MGALTVAGRTRVARLRCGSARAVLSGRACAGVLPFDRRVRRPVKACARVERARLGTASCAAGKRARSARRAGGRAQSVAGF